MSEHGRPTPDRRSVHSDVDTSARHSVRNTDAVVRQVAAFFGLKETEVEYVAQVPDDAIPEQEWQWEIWEREGKGTLQIRATWSGRLLPEETHQPSPPDVREPHEGHGPNRNVSDHSSHRRRDEPSGEQGTEGSGGGEGR